MDQRVKADAGKPRLTLVPTEITRCIAKVREFAWQKYGEQGIKHWEDVEPQRWKDAAYRHFLAYLDDPHSVDEESKLPHLWHLACNVAFLCTLEKDAKYKELLKRIQNTEAVIMPLKEELEHGTRIQEPERITQCGFKCTPGGQLTIEPIRGRGTLQTDTDREGSGI